MKTSETRPFDMADYLKTEEDINAYLSDVFAEGDLNEITYALGVVARIKGIAKIAQETGLGRESLYKSLSANGNPSFSTILKVMNALNLRFQITQFT